MKIRDEVRRRDSRIDLIPLLDCIFLLVVFFMYAMLTLVTQQGLSLNLPSAESATFERGERISLSVRDSETIFWNDEALSWEQLDTALAQLFQELSEAGWEPTSVEAPWIFVRADQSAEYGLVVKLLDRLRHHQLRKVSLETHD